jgi:two-component system OmpR family response regulator
MVKSGVLRIIGVMETKPPVRLLFVEDDPKLADLVCRGLRREGYEVDHAADGETGLVLAERRAYSLLITDLMLPGRDGLSLVTALRQNNARIPVLVLSAKSSVNERIEGLRAGADDYLVKPFSFGELLARMDALLRRARMEPVPTVLEVEDLRVDLLSGKVFRAETEIELQPQEYALLVYLMRNRGRIISRTAILAEVWQYNIDPLTNVVESRICKLRKKVDGDFGPRLIQTIRGQGYALRPVA